MSSSESVVTESDSSSSDVTISLLDRLRSPPLSELSRKRKTPSNPPKGLKRGKGTTASEPQSITAAARLREFPNQHLSVCLGKLLCDACREPLSLKKSVVALHLKSAKHTSGVERIESKHTREKNIVDLLNKYNQEVHPVGEGLLLVQPSSAAAESVFCSV